MNINVQEMKFFLEQKKSFMLFPLDGILYLMRLVVWENISELAQLCRLHQLERTLGVRRSSGVSALNSQILCLCIYQVEKIPHGMYIFVVLPDCNAFAADQRLIVMNCFSERLRPHLCYPEITQKHSQ